MGAKTGGVKNVFQYHQVSLAGIIADFLVFTLDYVRSEPYTFQSRLAVWPHYPNQICGEYPVRELLHTF